MAISPTLFLCIAHTVTNLSWCVSVIKFCSVSELICSVAEELFKELLFCSCLEQNRNVFFLHPSHFSVEVDQASLQNLSQLRELNSTILKKPQKQRPSSSLDRCPNSWPLLPYHSFRLHWGSCRVQEQLVIIYWVPTISPRHFTYIYLTFSHNIIGGNWGQDIKWFGQDIIL